MFPLHNVNFDRIRPQGLITASYGVTPHLVSMVMERPGNASAVVAVASVGIRVRLS